MLLAALGTGSYKEKDSGKIQAQALCPPWGFSARRLPAWAHCLQNSPSHVLTGARVLMQLVHGQLCERDQVITSIWKSDTGYKAEQWNRSISSYWYSLSDWCSLSLKFLFFHPCMSHPVFSPKMMNMLLAHGSAVFYKCRGPVWMSCSLSRTWSHPRVSMVIVF